MYNYDTLFEIQKELSNRSFSCKDLVQFHLEQIQTHRHLNAFIEVFEQEALKKAETIDKKITAGTAGKLHGLVIGLKDVICYKDQKVSAASKILSGFTSLYSATATDRLLKEDAIIIGRLNCDEFGMGSTNENSAFGPVLNHRDNAKVSGGSSGGAAVAVQANLCQAALGSDTGGSVRMPASFCGTVGLKPTYGRVSRYGLIAYASSFDQIGPVTKSIEDVAVILEVIAGKDDYDSTVSNEKVPEYSKSLELSNLPTVAFITDTLKHPALDPEIRQQIEAILDQLSSAGGRVESVNTPHLDYLVPAYYVLTTAEASSNLARYDGVHFGVGAEAQDINSLYKKARSKGFGHEVKRRIMLGTFVLSAGYYEAYYAKAQKVRNIIRETTEGILRKHDFIILPVTPTTAYNIGEKTKDPIEMYLGDLFTVQASLTGLPAISLPLGQHSNGMPFGVQIIANKFAEQKLFAFSKYLMSGDTIKKAQV